MSKNKPKTTKKSKPQHPSVIDLTAQPEGFQFKPACGTNNNGLITVSGMVFPEEEVIRNGNNIHEFIDLLQEIDESMRKNGDLPEPLK